MTKITRQWLLALISFSGMLPASCENELKDAKTISAESVENSVQRFDNAELIYSDSAHVKAKLQTPLLLHYDVVNPYDEMPKGVLVIFYNEKLEEQNRVSSRYAIRKNNEKITELRDHVVIKTKAGDTYKSEQMFWDENTRKFYSNTLLTRISKKGEIGYAASFESDENFVHPIFPQGTSGVIILPENTAP